MEKELTKLKRRPFMFPLLLPILVLAVAVLASVWLWDMRSTTVVVLAPHAEIDAGTDPDPNLSLAGRERAAHLARVLAQLQGTRGVDAIFAADTRASQQTAAPLAESLSLPTNILPAAAWSELPSRLSNEQRGKVSLVIGNSTTLPPAIAALSGVSITLRDNELDRLYIIFIPRLESTRLLQLQY